VIFDPENQTHSSAVAAYACLTATLFGIPIPYEKPRSAEAKAAIAKLASEIEVPDFVPSDAKATEIASQVEKEKAGKEAAEPEEEQSSLVMETGNPDEIDTLKKSFADIIVPLRADKDLKPMSVEEFEKDNDENYHVDFVHAMANVRAQNYKLDEMDWITVKIKAGKIVPALATTTAAIAGLQTIELIKYLKDCKLVEFRNSFLNLAVPSLMQSEPGPAQKFKVGPQEVTLWDRWEYDEASREVTLRDVVEHLEKTYKLEARDVFFGSIPLYMHALNIGKDRKQALGQLLLLALAYPAKTPEERAKVEWVDLTVTFVDPTASGEEEKVLENVPTVRVWFQ